MPLQLLVTQPQEAFVRKNETKIRSSAGEHTLKKELHISAHLDAVLMAEDLAESAALMENAFLARIESGKGKPADRSQAETWGLRVLQANQIKYYHLNQLSEIVI